MAGNVDEQPAKCTGTSEENNGSVGQGRFGNVSGHTGLSVSERGLEYGNVDVRANFDNPQGILKSGLYVSITLPYGEADNAMLVKEASIGTDQLGKYLYLSMILTLFVTGILR